MNRFWSETIKDIEPYVPGEQPRDKKYIKLNTNENPYPPSPRVLEAIQRETGSDLRLYPDPDAEELKKDIAGFYGVQRNEVFVGNGSDEVLAFTFPAFFNQGCSISFPDITYSFFPVYARLFRVYYHTLILNEDFTIPFEQFLPDQKGILIANPNAPTGIAVGRNRIERLLQDRPNTLVLIDEAYVDFGAESVVPLMKKYDNLLVVRTFSKSRSLAGLRIGFAIGNTGLIEALERVKNSFNSYTLDRVAQKAAIAAIQDREYFAETCQRIIKTRESAAKKMEELGFTVIRSKANFLFVSHKTVPGAELFSKLKDNGVLVRHFNKPRIDNWLRISIGNEEEMGIFIEKLTNNLI